ncbi:MAG: two-component sensor histidine kinase [Flavobacteriaceae bacterium]|nr:MAG: two-component sensor histidine kinase [Flavobacteriaceae bacterium]
MKQAKYTYLLILISITIALTIGAQLYWNYTNYLTNKQRITNEIQLSLDNALEEYYADLAKNNYFSIIEEGPYTSGNFLKNIPFDSILSEINPKFIIKKKESIPPLKAYTFSFEDSTMQSAVSVNLSKTDSPSKEKQFLKIKEFNKIKPDNISNITIIKGKHSADSINLITGLNKIIISFQQDTIAYSQVDSLLNIQLAQRNIAISKQLYHYKNDSLYYPEFHLSKPTDLFVTSKSTFLKKNENIQLYFSSPFADALRRSATGILLSLLLSCSIIGCLFYLLHIINNQKQLSEIKNDLISNITHEFKTPIATISVALESLQNFGGLNNPQKTKLYLDTSTQQLTKLQLMVEKLLETAALDNSEYELDLQNINLSNLTEKIVQRQQHLHTNYQFNLNISDPSIYYNLDEFHFENALNNLLDNAVKYGKSQVFIDLKQENNGLILTISDDGKGMKKQHKNKVFEQFFRIPTGNTHTIKGFGIGLYYCKSIIEKTGGTIHIEGIKNNTFIIKLPYDQFH